jgi:hypothetical protein
VERGVGQQFVAGAADNGHDDRQAKRTDVFRQFNAATIRQQQIE